jgi:Fur family transcriptional regulator, ferric uptake regulator
MKKEIKKLLEINKLKVTKGRVAILDFLYNSTYPVHVEAIKQNLLADKIKVDTVTIYRILDVFLKKGIIRRVEFNEGKFRYEKNSSHHHHLICTNCGKVQDINDCKIVPEIKHIEKQYSFLINDHKLEIYGICLKCR